MSLLSVGARHPVRALFGVVLALCGMGAAAAADPEPHVYKNGDFSFAVAPPPAWVIARDVPSQWPDDATGARNGTWRNWLIDSQVDRRHGKLAAYRDNAFEALSTEFVQDAGKQQLWFNPEYQTLTLHRIAVRRNGVWSDRFDPKTVTLARRERDFEHDMSDGMVSALIVLNDIRVGDVVRVSYSIEGENPVLAGQINDTLLFGARDPMLDRYARVLFDRNAKITERRDPGAPASEQVHGADALEWRVRAHAVAGVVDEGNYPIWFNPVATIDVGETRSWADVAAWARALYPVPQPLPDDLRSRIAEWRKLSTPALRAAAALRAMQEEVRYFGTEIGISTHKPAEPALTWSRRYGDCKDKARLLAAVLQALDIEAYPALVSTVRGRAIADLPPAASVFDHVIVRAKIDGSIVWLDATQTQQRGSPLLRVPDEFGVALPIGSGNALVPIDAPASAVDRVRVTEHLSPSATERSVTLRVDSQYEGTSADRMRRRLKSTDEAEVRRSCLDFYRKRYGEVSAGAVWRVEDDEQANVLHVFEEYVLKDPWIGNTVGRRTFDLYAETVADLLRMPRTGERHAPLAIAFPADVREETQMELPAGWRVVSAPGDHTLEDAATRYELHQTTPTHGLNVVQSVGNRAPVVTVEAFPRHFALLREANDLLGQRLVIAVDERQSAEERDKRLQNLMRNILDEKPAKERQ